MTSSTTKTKTRILFIHASADLGGTEVSSFQLASHLDRDKYEVAVLFHCQAGSICENYRRSAVPFWMVSFPRIVLALKIIRQFNPDIIQIYGLKTNVLWRPLLYFKGYRNLIGVIQGLTNQGDQPSRARLFWDRLTHRFLRSYVVNSQLVTHILSQKGFESSKLHVIYNGIILPALTPSQGKLNDPPIIVCVGNLRPVKGHQYLLQTLKILHDQGIQFQAWIVGDGPLKETLVRQSESLHLERSVSFLGRVESVEAILRKADIFVSLSLSEGVPIALMEAMSFSLPVVATNVGGVSELLSNGENGFLIPNMGIQEAADHLALLLSQPQLRRQMGRKARAKIELKFSLDNTVQGYEKLYTNNSQDVINTNRLIAPRNVIIGPP